MSFAIKDLVAGQFESHKADMMSTVVEVENLLKSITWTFFNPDDAPTSVGSLWSEAMGVAWEKLEKLQKYAIDQDFANFLETTEFELDNIVDKFFKWTDRVVIDTNEAAELFGKHRSTIYRWIKQGKLNAKKVGGRWQIAA